MSASIRTTIIFVVHIAFLFASYGSHFFGLALPYNLVIAIWLGASSLLAAVGYYWAFALFKTNSAHVAFTVVATCASLFTGVFLAFNTYGT